MRVRLFPQLRLFTIGFLVFLLPALSGCSIKPNPLNRVQLDHQVSSDLQAMFADMVFPQEPLTLEQAVALAIHNNLQQRVVVLEGAVALGLNEQAIHALLPQIQLSANNTQRDRATYPGQDRFQNTTSLEATWNVLDFGVSYLTAKQKADGVLIAQQQRRKAALDLLFDVETAFGQGLVAQRLDGSLKPLVERIEHALANAREVERQGIQPVQESLDFQKKLLKILDGLQRLQRQVSGSKIQLAQLLNLSSSSFPTLVDPGFLLPLDIEKLPDVAHLEEFALHHRPELLERHYQGRIQADESRKTLLRLLPGLELSSARKYDNGSLYVNRHWAEHGVNLAWNLLKVVTGPQMLAQASLEEAVEERRRLALAMTIMTQVRIAHLGLMESKVGYETARAMSQVDRRLFDHAQAGREVASMSEAQLIEAEADWLLQDARRDLAYAEVSSAAARLLVSVGLNRLPAQFDNMDTQQLTQALEDLKARPAWATYAPPFPPSDKIAEQKTPDTEAVKPTPAPPPTETPPPSDPLWIIESQGQSDPIRPSASRGEETTTVGMVLRVGSFAERDKAQELYTLLADKNYPVILQPLTEPDGRVTYRVDVGPIREERDGLALVETLNVQERLNAVPVLIPPFKTDMRHALPSHGEAITQAEG